jgi:hypothetical protein
MRTTLGFVATIISSGLALLAGTASTEPLRKATIVTTQGETLEGSLSGLSELYVQIETAGRFRTIPVQSVRYVSFYGTVGAPPPTAAPPSGSVADALDAVATRNAMFADAAAGAMPCYGGDDPASKEREEACIDLYWETMSSIANAVWPRVNAFLRLPGKDWADMKVWVTKAFHENDPVTLARYVEVARRLSADPGERTHREFPAVLDLYPDVAQSGRLGFGDLGLPEEVDKDHAGQWADQYRVALDSSGRVRFSADCLPSDCAVVLVDGRGRRIGKEEGFALEKVLGPGHYSLWVVNKEPSVYELVEKVESVTAKTPGRQPR